MNKLSNGLGNGDGNSGKWSFRETLDELRRIRDEALEQAEGAESEDERRRWFSFASRVASAINASQERRDHSATNGASGTNGANGANGSNGSGALNGLNGNGTNGASSPSGASRRIDAP